MKEHSKSPAEDNKVLPPTINPTTKTRIERKIMSKTIIPPCTRSGENGTSPPIGERLDMTVGWVIERILTDDQFVRKALAILYNLQTPEEQHFSETLRRNRVGFSVADAQCFSRLARLVLQGGRLSPDDLQKCRELGRNGIPRLAKYRRQIVEALPPSVPLQGGGVAMSHLPGLRWLA